MKKIVWSCLAIFMMIFGGCSTTATADTAKVQKKMPMRFQAVPMEKATIVQKGENKLYCSECGMTLPMFYKTNHVATVDGRVKQFCSIHCMVDVINQGKRVTDMKVVDNSTLKLIDVSNAWYVVGSSKPATMSKVSKYAFGTKADAQKFAKEFGGEVMNFEATLNKVKAGLTKESAMIGKKQEMMSKKGEMMYKKLCKPIETKFSSVADAKAYIKKHNSCGKINGKQLQALGLYLGK